MSKSYFKAPQRALKSSMPQPDDIMRKPRLTSIIKKSLGRRPQAIGKIEGSYVPVNLPKGSYEY
jgi:hypothetical protein